MPRRNLLTPAERAGLLALPATDDERIQHYTLAEPDLSVIHQRRGSHNRLGFGVQLCYLRFPGIALPTNAEPPTSLLSILSHQLHIAPDVWPQYARRPETRREHLLELPAWLRLTPFTVADHRHCVLQLSELAQQTDRGIVLAEALVGMLRQQRIILPTVDVIERVCSEALTSGTRRVYEAHVLVHLERLSSIHELVLPDYVEPLMLRKLGSYPRQNGLAVALRELGRIERTLFALD